MKKLFSLILLLIFLAIGGVIFFPSQDASSEKSASRPVERPDRNLKSEKNSPDSPRAETHLTGDPNDQSSLVTQDTPASQPQQPKQPEKPAQPDQLVVAKDPFIKKIITSKWLDTDENKAGRRRVRIVEADFKYPRLRLEEEVWTNPETGKQTVKRVRASVADHVMVGLKPGADEEAATEVLEDNGYRILAVEPDSYILAELPEFDDVDDQKKSIADIEALNDFIDYAEPDWIVYPSVMPNDPAFSSRKMWGLDNPGTVAGTKADADIDAPEGWDIRHDAPNVIVAVTDTGIRYTHEDLAPNMWMNGDGQHGYDAYDDDTDPMDTGGHGTHCAGTIGAVGNNGKGLTGVAWSVKLMALRFLGSNGGTTSDGIRVINYARLNGAHIISASWGGGGYSHGLRAAIMACYDANIPFVAAAGNDSSNTDATPHYPSSYDPPNVISVASTDSADKLSYFSNYGSTNVDLAAPGGNIWSCGIDSDTDYKYLSGTSMATPHVAGTLALAKAHFLGESCEDLITRIYTSVDRAPALEGKVATGGRLNLVKLYTESSPAVLHDDFAKPYWFDGCYGYWCGSNARMTREADEDTFSPDTGQKSLWFRWTAPSGGLVRFKGSGRSGDVSVVAFEGDARTALTRIADNFDERITSSSYLYFYVEEGKTYSFSVDSRSNVGQILIAELLLRPDNDMLLDASELASGARFSDVGTNCGATEEAFEHNYPHAGVGKGKSVWWKWTPDFNGEFVITTQGSEFDTVLAVYTGTPEAGLTEVATNDDRNNLDWTSQVTVNAQAGVTYLIAVDGYRGDASGEITLSGFQKGQLMILDQPESMAKPVGGRAVFSVGILSEGNVRYSWFFNGQPIPGADEATYIIPSIGTEHFGNYQVNASNQVDSVTSNTVVLNEKILPPEVYWVSGNQSVFAGADVTFSVQARGGLPLQYQWFKGDIKLDGDTTPQLTLTNVQPADVGNYRVEVLNDLGMARAEMYLGIVASPLDGWEWRRPGIENAPITDIQVIGNEVYAISGNLLLISSDGENWEKRNFPQGFTANSIAAKGGEFVCIGRDVQNSLAVVKSPDATNWTMHSPVGLNASYTDYRIYSFQGVYLIKKSGYSVVQYSSDGVNWSVSQSTALNNTTKALLCNGQLSSDGNAMIAASTQYGVNGELRYFKTTDGVSWTEHQTQTGNPNSWSSIPSQSAYANGKFYLFESRSIFSSADSVNWTHHSSSSNGIGADSITSGVGGDFVALSKTSNQLMRWFTVPEQLQKRTVYPKNSQNFTAVKFFNNLLIYGTNKGHIRTAAALNDVNFAGKESLSGLSAIQFLGGEFFAETNSATKLPFISGDGVTWKKSHELGGDVVPRIGYARGKHWGMNGNTNWLGDAYHDLREPLDEYDGLTTLVRSVSERADGAVLAWAEASTGGGVYNVYTRAPGNTAWVESSLPFTTSSNQRFVHAGGKWFTQSAAAQFYVSSDGLNWRSTSGFISVLGYGAAFSQINGTYYVVTHPNYSRALEVYSSSDGINWVALNSIGWPTNAGQSIKNLAGINGSFIADIYNAGIYVSNDAISWVKAPLPAYDVIGFAAGKDQIVIALESGGILQVGSPHPGANAPLAEITTPQPSSSHMLHSKMIISGEVSDPEDGAVAYSLTIDGIQVLNGTGNEFSYEFVPKSLRGHTVRLITEDSQGLVGSDVIRVSVTAAEPDNLISDGLGVDRIATEHLAAFAGAYYAANSRTLYRSLDGFSWDTVPLPSQEYFIHAMVSGNGSLVIQYENGSFLTTRDGINWVHFSPKQRDFRLSYQLRFESGYFMSGYNNSSSTGGIITSKDGITWQVVEATSEGGQSWQAISLDGIVVGVDDNIFSGALRRSSDGGNNWQNIEELSQQNFWKSDGVYGSGKFVILNRDTNRVYISLNGLTWTSVPAPANDLRNIYHLDGRFFIGGFGFGQDRLTLDYSSSDAVNWQPMSVRIKNPIIAYARGLFVAATWDGIATSEDGVTWKAVVTSEPLPSIEKLASNDEGFIAIGSAGEVWSSPDGYNWSKELNGGQSAAASSVPSAIEQFGNRLILVGSKGLLRYSDDDGVTWQDGNIDNSPASPSDFNAIELQQSDHCLMMISTKYSSEVYRSTDGISWTEVSSLNNIQAQDLAFNGSDWMIVGEGGEMMRSTDDGITWTSVPAPLLKRGSAIAWFNNQWVIIGSIEVGWNQPFHTLTLDPNDLLEDWGAVGFYNSSGPVSIIQAHGLLLLWNRGEHCYVSNDGKSWAESDLDKLGIGPGSGTYDIYATASGFTAFLSSNSASYPVKMAKSGSDGLVWNSVTRYYNNISAADAAGDRAFVFSYGKVFEESFADLSLDFGSQPALTLGVGDTASFDISIQNLGQENIDASTWKVEAWLSKDAFFGDSNDSYLGSSPLPQLVIASSSSQSETVTFEIPEVVKTGGNFVILRLVNTARFTEINKPNNTVISDAQMITIPEWALSLNTNGEGQIRQDFAAPRYPQGARISLTANAGKGAAFAGWGGDALGAESQITILMDGNKSVQANFSSRTSLQVLERGFGSVSGLASLGSYAVNGTASLTAIPADGWVFSGWSGAATGGAPTANINMSDNKVVTATFTKLKSTWRSDNFTEAQLLDVSFSGDDADPDGDGLKNWQEYLHLSDPKNAASRGIVRSKVEGGFLYTIFTRNAGIEGSMSLACQGSRDMLDWDVPDFQKRVLSTANGVETVEARIPTAGNDRGFLRLNYQQ